MSSSSQYTQGEPAYYPLSAEAERCVFPPLTVTPQLPQSKVATCSFMWRGHQVGLPPTVLLNGRPHLVHWGYVPMSIRVQVARLTLKGIPLESVRVFMHWVAAYTPLSQGGSHVNEANDENDCVGKQDREISNKVE